MAVTLGLLCAANAQLAFQNFYPAHSRNQFVFEVVDLLLSGKKYCLIDIVANQVTLYNLNHSVWKTITPPTVSGYQWGAYTGNVGNISENLFKIDNKVDLWLPYHISSSTYQKLIVFDETGTIISTVDSASQFFIRNIGLDSFVALVYKDSGTVVYGLPGKLPCHACSTAPGLGMPINDGSGFGSSLSETMPNPSSSITKIEYNIPTGSTGVIRIFDQVGRQMKSYIVDSHFDYITIDNTELPPGVYYYNLTTNSNQTTAKKMVVIR